MLIHSMVDICITVACLMYPFPVGARLMFKGVDIPGHSLVVRETIGVTYADTLMCDYSSCCTDPEDGWVFDFGTSVFANSGGFYQTRGDGVVRLHYNGGNADGIFRCQIRISTSVIQTLFVGVYPRMDDNSGAGVNGDGKSV